MNFRKIFFLLFFVTSNAFALDVESLDCDEYANTFSKISHEQPSPFQSEIWNENQNQDALNILKLLCEDRKFYVSENLYMKRDGHAKGHGCVSGKIEIDNSNLPEDAKVGIFKENKSHELFARFSSASGKIQSDRIGDIIGLAIKVKNVPYESYLSKVKIETNNKEQDLLFINLENFFIDNTKDYLSFVKAFRSGKLAMLWYGVKHPVQFVTLIKALKKNLNLLGIDYFSSTPYRLNSYVIKSKLEPCKISDQKSKIKNYEENLRGQFNQSEQCFNYYIQFNKNYSIEDALTKWHPKNSPLIKVGKIIFPKQELETGEKCEIIDFNPWRTPEEQRPLGQINRIRLQVYKAQSELRNAYNQKQKEPITYIEQGWTKKDRNEFYSVDQGARIINFEHFKNVESLQNKILFSSPDNLKKYGFLYDTVKNSDLPIGLVNHNGKLGISCALCHTSDLNYKGFKLRINGGSSLSDTPTFLRDLKDALAKTQSDPQKYLRFQKRILGANANPEEIENLKKSLNNSVSYLTQFFDMNKSDVTPGYGRIDAVGWITNRIIKFLGHDNYIKPSAPANYPYLWDSHRIDWFHYSGIVSNTKFGKLARNVGQAVGSFSDIELTNKPKFLGLGGYKSSIDVKELQKAQKLIEKLNPPKWPEDIFGKINYDLAKNGKILYEEKCIKCHSRVDRENNSITKTTLVDMNKVGTDPQYANQLYGANINTGIMKGSWNFSKNYYTDKAPMLYLYRDIVKGIILYNRDALALEGREFVSSGKIFSALFPSFRKTDSKDPMAKFLVYRAKPLHGIWTSAPFFHNGSVPTLWDVLSAQENRPKTFYVGNYSFDPIKVGYDSSYQKDDNNFLFDTQIPGNSNQGHNVGAHLNDEDRKALIEYLKTL